MAQMKFKIGRGTDRKTILRVIISVIVMIAVSFITREHLPKRTVIAIFVPLSLGLFILTICLHLFKNPKNKVIQLLSCYKWLLPTLAFICIIPHMYLAHSYTFVDGSSLPFWKFDLTIGIICGALFFIFSKKPTGYALWKFILTGIVVVIVSALFVSYYTQNLNYLLDTSDGQEYTAVIEGKEAVRHRKSPQTYEFRLKADGREIALDVTAKDYKNYEKGDSYTFKKYNGAFGVPFYTSE